MSETNKAYIRSSIITFIAAFASVIVVQVDSLSLSSLQDGTIVGLLFAGIRAGFKALFTLIAGWKV